MIARFRFLLALTLTFLAATPVFAAKPATPSPSVRLRTLIDKTMVQLSTISDPRQQPINRTALSTAQADYTAQAITAPPAEQPMYQAAQAVVTSLVSAVEEHEKAVADYRYSNSVHGKQDRENAVISNPQHGRDAGAVARADNAKQKMENADSRKALLDKEKFMNEGTIATWTNRVGQLHTAIEQSLVAEMVAEKQYAMIAPPGPPPPAPKPKKTKEISAAEQYSPVGTWKAANPSYRSPILKEDSTVTGGDGKNQWIGTWKWTDQSKGALSIAWSDGMKTDVNFSADGRTLSGKNSNGHTANFTRSSEAVPSEAAATAPLDPAAKPGATPSAPTASGQSSAVGEWKPVNPQHRSATFNEDNTVTGGHGSRKFTGVWHWTDQSKGAVNLTWSDGLTVDLNISADGRTMSGQASNGGMDNYTRSTGAAPDASAAPPAVAEIRLNADLTKGLSIQRDKAVALSSSPISKIKIQPGLKDPTFVSLQLVGTKGFYLRHSYGILYLHQRPQSNALFDADASFKIVHLDGDRVRFESFNFPGTFITAREDGSVVVVRDCTPAQSIFILKAQ